MMSLAQAIKSGGLVSAESEAEVMSLYEEVLKSNENFPAELKGSAADMLGLAWKNHKDGDPRENKRGAIHYMKQALEYFDPIKDPQDWATVENNIGQA
jgi:hypothetical protein